MRNVEYEKSDLAELHDVIVDYLENNPNAADSLEGIMNYWLPQAYQKIDRAKIEQVLEQLIDEGQVRKIILADKSILFRQG
ncbi:MAG: hypothetical protein DHS20C13_28830 [Thermodesulfobacteriota bacterium]|nr:MAG: hypothetical protein DHS20C13_28830 [Thermodesulfobacteriota bacterium]